MDEIKISATELEEIKQNCPENQSKAGNFE